MPPTGKSVEARIAGDVGVAGGVDGDAPGALRPGVLVARAAEERRIDQRGAGGIELRHERVAQRRAWSAGSAPGVVGKPAPAMVCPVT